MVAIYIPISMASQAQVGDQHQQRRHLQGGNEGRHRGQPGDGAPCHAPEGSALAKSHDICWILGGWM